jgi:hypothetical protein
MTRHSRWTLVVVIAVVVLPIPTWVAWQSWRAHTLRSFCREVRVGLPVADLGTLEQRHWIDASYLVLPPGDGLEHQAQMPELTFRSHMYDPDFECVITQNGVTVTAATLVPE